VANNAGLEVAHDPQDLERLLVARQRMGDVEGMVALYEPEAVIDCGAGKFLHGKEEIRAYFLETITAGRKFEIGVQSPAIIGGGLALTSTRFASGSVTAEVARQQMDGTWLWIIDKFAIV
jgi:hypothetical protein